MSSRWYTRESLDAESKATCPRCDARQNYGPLFTQHTYECVNCKCKLIQWMMIRNVFIIDFNNCPSVVKSIIDYTQRTTTIESYRAVSTLMELFGEAEREHS